MIHHGGHGEHREKHGEKQREMQPIRHLRVLDHYLCFLLFSAVKGGTACSLRSRCPPFVPHVMSVVNLFSRN